MESLAQSYYSHSVINHVAAVTRLYSSKTTAVHGDVACHFGSGTTAVLPRLHEEGLPRKGAPRKATQDRSDW